jgi:hypothetical protein
MVQESNELQTQVIQQLKEEIIRLNKLIFQVVPVKSYSLRKLWSKDKPRSFGGAGDYEVWLRTLDHMHLNWLIKLHTGAIDSLRYRRRFIQHESERRFLHSSYGATPAEALFDSSGDLQQETKP